MGRERERQRTREKGDKKIERDTLYICIYIERGGRRQDI